MMMALLLVLGAPLSVPAAGTEFMYSGWTERVKGIVEVSASLRARGNYEEAGRKLDSLDLAEHDDPDGYAALAVSGANYALGLALFQIADYPGAVHRLGSPMIWTRPMSRFCMRLGMPTDERGA